MIRLQMKDEDVKIMAPLLAQEVATLLKPYFSKEIPQDEVNFTVESLAVYLDTSPAWVYKHMAILPRFKIDGLIRFRKRDIDKLIQQNYLKVYQTK